MSQSATYSTVVSALAQRQQHMLHRHASVSSWAVASLRTDMHMTDCQVSIAPSSAGRGPWLQPERMLTEESDACSGINFNAEACTLPA